MTSSFAAEIIEAMRSAPLAPDAVLPADTSPGSTTVHDLPTRRPTAVDCGWSPMLPANPETADEVRDLPRVGVRLRTATVGVAPVPSPARHTHHGQRISAGLCRTHASTTAGVRSGGREERSCSPAWPSARWRPTHSCTVAREMPSCSAILPPAIRLVAFDDDAADVDGGACVTVRHEDIRGAEQMRQTHPLGSGGPPRSSRHAAAAVNNAWITTPRTSGDGGHSAASPALPTRHTDVHRASSHQQRHDRIQQTDSKQHLGAESGQDRQ